MRVLVQLRHRQTNGTFEMDADQRHLWWEAVIHGTYKEYPLDLWHRELIIALRYNDNKINLDFIKPITTINYLI
jgi:hypothetical protein